MAEAGVPGAALLVTMADPRRAGCYYIYGDGADGGFVLTPKRELALAMDGGCAWDVMSRLSERHPWAAVGVEQMDFRSAARSAGATAIRVM